MNDYTKRIAEAMNTKEYNQGDFIEIYNSISQEFSNFLGPVSPLVAPFLALLFKKYLSFFEQEWPGCSVAGDIIGAFGEDVSVVVPHHRKED